MNIHLHSQERHRISTGSSGGISQTFMDIESGKDQYGISVEAYTMHRLEIRKKANVIKLFAFPKDEYYKDYDFGWWSDADVIWTNLNDKDLTKQS